MYTSFPTFPALSVADVLGLDHAFGVGFATKFVAEVDPWVHADEQTKAAIGVKSYVQSTFEKYRASSALFGTFTDERKTSYLLSPFPKLKLKRALVRKSQSRAAPAAPAPASATAAA